MTAKETRWQPHQGQQSQAHQSHEALCHANSLRMGSVEG
jgi:hypothetical protein